jgi:hypothetical protein
MGIIHNLELNMKEISMCRITNYQYINNKINLPTNILNECDIFIYQPIDKRHGIYSTEKGENNIMSYLKPDCLKISFPYLYNSGIWGITKDAIDKDDGTECGNRDSIAKLKSKSLEEVIDMYRANKIDFNYKSRFEMSLSKLQEKEKKCDIHVSEFIKNNIKTNKLFFTQNHPTPYLFAFVSNQILELIKIKFIQNMTNTQYIFTNYNELCNGPKWPISKNDIDFWNFTYIQDAEEDADNYYIELITKYYNNIKNIDEGIADVYY